MLFFDVRLFFFFPLNLLLNNLLLKDLRYQLNVHDTQK